MGYRLRGFLIHLLASALLATAAICIVYLVWYPAPLAQAVGVTNIFLLLLSVDVVIGPLLTFALCKEGKKGLIFDLSLIVILQLSAFTYGFYTIAQGRPVWLSYNKDRFDLVQAFEMHHKYQAQAKPEFQNLSLTGPKWVAVQVPPGIESLYGGVDVPKRSDLYEDLNNQKDLMRKHAQPLETLYKYNDKTAVEAALKKWPQANAFLALKSSPQSVTVLINRESAEIIAIVLLNPWY